MAITLFTRKLLAGEPVTIFGDGSMRRDFTHVDDIVRGVLAALDHAPAGFRAYNLGSGAPVDLQNLVQAIADAAGRTPSLERAARPLGDVDATYADVSRAKADFEWSPHIPLREGLRSVVEWVRANP
jgi:UDP-glucuronate 4-epimerase